MDEEKIDNLIFGFDYVDFETFGNDPASYENAVIAWRKHNQIHVTTVAKAMKELGEAFEQMGDSWHRMIQDFIAAYDRKPVVTMPRRNGFRPWQSYIDEWAAKYAEEQSPTVEVTALGVTITIPREIPTTRIFPVPAVSLEEALWTHSMTRRAESSGGHGPRPSSVTKQRRK